MDTKNVDAGIVCEKRAWLSVGREWRESVQERLADLKDRCDVFDEARETLFDISERLRDFQVEMHQQLRNLDATVTALQLERQATNDDDRDFAREVHQACKCPACMFPLVDHLTQPQRERLEKELRVACTCLACVRNKEI